MLAGEAPVHLRITEAGTALEVTWQPARKPLAGGRTNLAFEGKANRE
jgi:hypothetical protein